MHERVPNSAEAASAIAAQHCTAQQPGQADLRGVDSV